MLGTLLKKTSKVLVCVGAHHAAILTHLRWRANAPAGRRLAPSWMAGGREQSKRKTTGEELFDFLTFSLRGFASLLLRNYVSLVWYYGAHSHARLRPLIYRPL